MIRDVVVLYLSDTDMRNLCVILRWYRRYVHQLHPRGTELGMHRMLVELLHWRCSHLVLTCSLSQAWQKFGLAACDACALDIALTLFLCARHTRARLSAMRASTLTYVKRLRERLRGCDFPTHITKRGMPGGAQSENEQERSPARWEDGKQGASL